VKPDQTPAPAQTSLSAQASDEAAALALAESDVYARSGVWSGFTVRAFGRVVRSEELGGG